MLYNILLPALHTCSYPLSCWMQMVPLLKKSSEVLTEKMGEFAKSGKSVNISEWVLLMHLNAFFDSSTFWFRVYKAFTLEAILATAFGRYVDIQRGEADQLTEAARTVFSALEEGNARFSPEVLLVGLCKCTHSCTWVCMHEVYHHDVRAKGYYIIVVGFWTLQVILILPKPPLGMPIYWSPSNCCLACSRLCQAFCSRKLWNSRSYAIAT